MASAALRENSQGRPTESHQQTLWYNQPSPLLLCTRRPSTDPHSSQPANLKSARAREQFFMAALREESDREELSQLLLDDQSAGKREEAAIRFLAHLRVPHVANFVTNSDLHVHPFRRGTSAGAVQVHADDVCAALQRIAPSSSSVAPETGSPR